MRIQIMAVMCFVIAAITAGGVNLERHRQKNAAIRQEKAAILKIQHDAQASRDAVFKMMDEENEKIRTWREAEKAKAALKNQAFQDGCEELLAGCTERIKKMKVAELLQLDLSTDSKATVNDRALQAMLQELSEW
jgi:hypothetical protein